MQSLSLNSRSLPLFPNDVVCILSHSAPLSIALDSETKAVIKEVALTKAESNTTLLGYKESETSLALCLSSKTQGVGFPRACDLLSHKP